MDLAERTRLGPYEVIGAIGAGGMGEVYRARDTRLNREVALKILPEAVAQDEERVIRFEREARLLATISHPNIATIYGLELIDGRRLLTMELAEGEDLSARISRAPIPLPVALAIARQIAEALAEAHDKGIVHRDLKPANIKVSSDGAVKILDFGLARAFGESGEAETSKAGANSPTLTVGATKAGVILGTAAYMSPEQARGETVDKRADVWAFGGVLYEMLASRRAFVGATVSDTLAAVLTREPDWSALPVSTPEGIRRLLRWCLAKDPRRRLRDLRDVRLEIEESENGLARSEASIAVRASSERPLWRSLAPWFVALFALSAALGHYVARKPVPTEEPFRFSLRLPPDQQSPAWILTNILAPSPDGRKVAYVATASGVSSLWLWNAADGSFRRLQGTESAFAPFWSPDGRFLAFIAGDELRKIPADGGVTTTLCSVSFGSSGTWSTAGWILVAQWGGPEAGLWLVSAEGGQKKRLVGAQTPDQIRMWPAFLPDGRHYLFTTNTMVKPASERQVCVGRVDSDETVCLTDANSAALYAPPGTLILVRRGTLVAYPFDATALRLRGEPLVLEREVLWFGPTGALAAGVSADGRLLVTAPLRKAVHLTWFDRGGREIANLGDPRPFGRFQLSPDGGRLATDMWNPETGGRDLWVLDVATGLPSRLTYSTQDAVSPVWSPDGRRIAYGEASEGPPDIRVLRVDSREPGEWVLREPGPQFPEHWSSDSRYLAYQDINPGRRSARRIWLLEPGGKHRPLTSAPVDNYNPRFSPDARFIAYASEESGRPEVLVAPLDAPGATHRVSREGGILPRWRKDGRELYFLSPDGMLFAVRMRADGSPEDAAPTALFRVGSFFEDFTFEVAPDGQRFLIYGLDDRQEVPELHISLRWASGR